MSTSLRFQGLENGGKGWSSFPLEDFEFSFRIHRRMLSYRSQQGELGKEELGNRSTRYA
jgi:hypothetical protein